MPLENRWKKDTIDQSQGSSSRSANPERLQQLHRAHGFQPETKSNGKGIMSTEVQEQYNQVKQENFDKNRREAIQEVIKQRDGKTSSDSEIRLGYQEGLRGGAKDITLINLAYARTTVLNEFHDGNRSTRFATETQTLCTSVEKREESIRKTLQDWKALTGQDQDSQMKRRMAEIMLD